MYVCMIIVESIVITCKMSRSPEADHFSSYEGILDFNQVGYTFTPITYKIMISYTVLSPLPLTLELKVPLI